MFRTHEDLPKRLEFHRISVNTKSEKDRRSPQSGDEGDQPGECGFVGQETILLHMFRTHEDLPKDWNSIKSRSIPNRRKTGALPNLGRVGVGLLSESGSVDSDLGEARLDHKKKGRPQGHLFQLLYFSAWQTGFNMGSATKVNTINGAYSLLWRMIWPHWRTDFLAPRHKAGDEVLNCDANMSFCGRNAPNSDAKRPKMTRAITIVGTDATRDAPTTIKCNYVSVEMPAVISLCAAAPSPRDSIPARSCSLHALTRVSKAFRQPTSIHTLWKPRTQSLESFAFHR
jgi:hypothetical protein